MAVQRSTGGAERRSKAPTIGDVARAAGVSAQTVSNVLNAPHRVRRETRASVQTHIDRLGYAPHRSASDLRRQATRSIGYQVPPEAAFGMNALLDRFLHGICTAAQRRGHVVVLFTAPTGGSVLDIYDDMVRTRAVGGFVLAEVDYGDRRGAHLVDAGVPVAAFGRSPAAGPHDWVDVDGSAGVAAAVDRLVADGRRRIGFVGWPEGSLSGDARYRGWSQALGQAGLTADPALVVRGPNTPQTGRDAIAEWMERGIDVDAVVTAQDHLAVGVVQAASQRGLAVGRGDDLAVVGFDDDPIAGLLPPGLTTLRQPVEEIAERLVDRLVDRMTGAGGDARGDLVRPRLIARGTA